MSNGRIGISTVLACALLAGSCRESTGPHQARAGWQQVQLSTSAASVGIVRLTLGGGAIDSVIVPPGLRAFVGKPIGSTVPVIIVGNLSQGQIACAAVSDASLTYTVTVDEAASSTNYAPIPSVELSATVSSTSPSACP